MRCLSRYFGRDSVVLTRRTKENYLGSNSLLECEAILELNHLPNQKEASRFNHCLLRLQKNGFFDSTDIHTFQLFAEEFPLSRIGQTWQEKLHRKLLLFLLDKKYPILLKVSVCYSVLEMVKNNESELRHQALYDACMEYIFDHIDLLNLAEIMGLYRHGHSVSLLSLEECSFLESLVLKTISNSDLMMINEFFVLEFVWSLVLQKYRPLYVDLNTKFRDDFTPVQTDLLKTFFPLLLKSKAIRSSSAIRK